MTETDNQQQLVLVVHGVGDPSPGETVNLFARSIAEDPQPLDEHPEVVWLRDNWGDERNINTFPMYVRRVTRRGRSLLLAEVFWADVSTADRGLVGSVVNLFQVSFVSATAPSCAQVCTRFSFGTIRS